MITKVQRSTTNISKDGRKGRKAGPSEGGHAVIRNAATACGNISVHHQMMDAALCDLCIPIHTHVIIILMGRAAKGP